MPVFPALERNLGDRYRLEREIGRGGMATVYLAQDLKHRRQVAIKVLERESASPKAGERFQREIQTVARLLHPHILTVHDSGMAGEFPYFVMPFVEGESLRKRLDRERQLPLDDVVGLVREIATALDYAHASGIVHRDIKPENILLATGHAVVSDFGIAWAAAPDDGDGHMTVEGTFLGTPPYVSPEQVAGAAVLDARSDVYSLACLAFEMLAGQPPFTGTTETVFHQHLSAEPRPLSSVRPGLPQAVDAALAHGLAKRADDRPKSAGAFAAELARAADPKAPITTGSARVAARRTLAVLPFANLSADPEQEFFSDGMTQEIITRLAAFDARELGVIARTSAMRYKGTNKRIAEIGRELGVGYLVEGSVRRAGGRIRITAELLSAGDETHLWAESYDRDLADTFAVQSEVAEAIARSLAVKLLPARPERPTREAPRNPEAHDAYLRGLDHLRKRSATEARAAIQRFEEAIALEAEYAAAFTGIAEAGLVIASYGFARHRDAYPPARKAALRAVELDDTQPRAHAALGLVADGYDWDWVTGERELKRALELDPDDATARYWYGIHLYVVGRPDEAVREMSLARSLDPLSPIIRMWLGWVQFTRGALDEAEASVAPVLAQEPVFVPGRLVMGWIREAQGRCDEAREEYRRWGASGGTATVARVLDAHALASAGRREEARRALELARAPSATDYLEPTVVAATYEVLGERDLAFAWLQRALDERSTWLILLRCHPWLKSLREDPRFEAIAKALRFA